MMKRFVSFLAALALVLALVPAAEAAGLVMVSRQSLRVDGKVVDCQKYNIDGRNYFMLRDLALLLKDTGSRFSVEWDEEKRCVAVRTGEVYTPDGSDLDLTQGDQSGTAVISSQPIYIDWALRTDLTVYNIGGHNYFQLKELGTALGFFVDYDKESNTAVIISKAYAEPTPWLVREERELEAERFGERPEQYRCSTYDSEGRLLTQTSGFTANEYEWADSWTYDDLGRPVKNVQGSRNRETGQPGMQTVTTWEYDRWGNLAKVTTDDGDGLRSIDYFYDDLGRLTGIQEGDQRTAYTYDGAGNLLTVTLTYWDGTVLFTEYTYDEAGHTLLEREQGSEGPERSLARTWEGDLCVREVSTVGGYESVTDYTYDEAGNLLRREENHPDYNAVTTYAYDAQGRTVRQEWRCGDEFSGYTYEYDEAGNLLRETHTTSAVPDAARHNVPYTAEYAYNEEGLLVHKLAVENGVNITETSISYDRAAGKMTTLIEHSIAPTEEGD